MGHASIILEKSVNLYFVRAVWALREDGQHVLYALASSGSLAAKYRKMALMDKGVIRAKIELVPLDHVFGRSVGAPVPQKTRRAAPRTGD